MILKNHFVDSVHKTAVAFSFSKASHSYDQAASLQKEAGSRLLEMAGDWREACVLDAGCGTGYFSQYWRQRGNRILALDLSMNMLEQAKKKSAVQAYLLGDIEHLPITDQAIDLCFSNMAIQWCDDLKRVLAEFYRVTRPGGVILFSTLTMGSLKELAQAWQKIDGTSHTHDFLSFEEIRALCKPYRVQFKTRLSTLFFPDLRALMHSLKRVGANYVRRGRKTGLTGRGQFRQLETVYPITPQGYPLSYQLAYGMIHCG